MCIWSQARSLSENVRFHARNCVFQASRVAKTGKTLRSTLRGCEFVENECSLVRNAAETHCDITQRNVYTERMVIFSDYSVWRGTSGRLQRNYNCTHSVTLASHIVKRIILYRIYRQSGTQFRTNKTEIIATHTMQLRRTSPAECRQMPVHLSLPSSL